MDDAQFDAELDAYFNGVSPNWEMVDVEIVWVDGNLGYGSLHIVQHGVTKSEVEEALFETPPEVEAAPRASRANDLLGSNARRAVVIHFL